MTYTDHKYYNQLLATGPNSLANYSLLKSSSYYPSPSNFSSTSLITPNPQVQQPPQSQQQQLIYGSSQHPQHVSQPYNYMSNSYIPNNTSESIDYPIIKENNNRVSKLSSGTASHKSKSSNSTSPSNTNVILDRCTCRNSNSSTNDSNHIPRPRNAFILFRQQYHQSVLDEGNIIRTNPDVSRELGKRWRALPLDQKAYWNKAAEEEKKKHAEKYPGYRYIPRRSGKKNLCSYCKSREAANEKLKYDVSNHIQNQLPNQLHSQIPIQPQPNQSPMMIANNILSPNLMLPIQNQMVQHSSPITSPQPFLHQPQTPQPYQNQYYNQQPYKLPPLNTSQLASSINQQFPRPHESADTKKVKEQITLPHISHLGLPTPDFNSLRIPNSNYSTSI
ncbi:Rox1p ASCRUDRAFT_79438 [Ascoidea rubescens DSM 1968]|uniref:HMG box domain-containing protein n=1 Tax=Ascoidea rubescens DSM 1968 TaxID=1344418 RepID=A0A1D2VME6_9ASCO|nr:hypothetical protein ASCRUDRAFT_79438 [Ascoidea rubescens DSM 1968]ODV62781.1 hypothetical protein ASCRUDRAFT_79438 [Ascoidea rubescens DSM 1968]